MGMHKKRRLGAIRFHVGRLPAGISDDLSVTLAVASSFKSNQTSFSTPIL